MTGIHAPRGKGKVMDTSVTAIGEAIVAALRAAGYMESTINQYRKSIKWLGVLAQQQGGNYSLELGTQFASMTTSPHTGKYSHARHINYGRLVHLCDSYLLTGAISLGLRPGPDFSWWCSTPARRTIRPCPGGVEHLRVHQVAPCAGVSAGLHAPVGFFLALVLLVDATSGIRQRAAHPATADAAS